MRVLVALSGGVDSAVAAARVRDAGHEVAAVHLTLYRPGRNAAAEGAEGAAAGATDGAVGGAAGAPGVAPPHGGAERDAADARRVADQLGLPLTVWDFGDRFTEEIVADFTAGYASGVTPNPCVRCNERIKFGALLRRALDLGFDAVATGHYARLRPDGPDGQLRLHRATDLGKDQSYVLARLRPWQLAAAMFPLGDSTKAQVRAEAAARGLRVAEKRDSLDLCFIPDGDVRGWLTTTLGRRPGPIIDLDGRVVGRHEGAHGFTVGQRRGLSLGVPVRDGRPRYVVDVRPGEATVVVGPRASLEVTVLHADRAVWSGAVPTDGRRVGAQIRAHGEEIPGVLHRMDGDERVRVALDRPITGVAPGQALALYHGTEVLGGAVLTGGDR
jgi:tRNA-uridine 2-sulfurtransferase